jgi:hypothetical protein
LGGVYDAGSIGADWNRKKRMKRTSIPTMPRITFFIAFPLLPGLRIGFCVSLRKYFFLPVEKLSYLENPCKRKGDRAVFLCGFAIKILTDCFESAYHRKKLA